MNLAKDGLELAEAIEPRWRWAECHEQELVVVHLCFQKASRRRILIQAMVIAKTLQYGDGL